MVHKEKTKKHTRTTWGTQISCTIRWQKTLFKMPEARHRLDMRMNEEPSHHSFFVQPSMFMMSPPLDDFSKVVQCLSTGTCKSHYNRRSRDFIISVDGTEASRKTYTFMLSENVLDLSMWPPPQDSSWNIWEHLPLQNHRLWSFVFQF